ncbi:MAG: prolipoprotein diacylglyceryl transferase [Oligoflexia bacterium]|nr:prolipoprotein diacylglyceryl transferase [Oligoflexia bacterium]
MLAVIPYFSPLSFSIGSWTLGAWEILVALSFICGLEIARARAIKLGLDVRDIVDGVVVTVGMGFVGGHMLHVLGYHPELIQQDGWLTIFKVWGGLSSTGGFLGATLGSVLFYKVFRKRDYWLHADQIAFAFPFAWVIARMGCFSAHGHIGRKSDFFLAVDFPDGPRHDLGLDEALITAVIAITFFALRNRKVKPGFFLALLVTMYAPVRFGLDFLRNTDLSNADLRYSGLTPAQWIMLGLFAVGVWLVWRLKGQSRIPDPTEGHAEQPPG